MRSCFKWDLDSGQRFGSWTVISKNEEESRKKKYSVYICRCDCGYRYIGNVRGYRLTNGYSKNCKNCGAIKNGESRRIKNKYDLSGSFGVGWTSNTNREFYFDKDQYEKIKDYTWREHETTGYVTTSRNNKNVDLHRLVTNAKEGEIVDHIHGRETKMDNRSCNLRIVSKGQNNINVGIRSNNTSGVTGVSWHKTFGKWKSQIGYNGECIVLGYFKDFDDAVKARKEAEDKYYKDYSYDNSQNINKGGYLNGYCKS